MRIDEADHEFRLTDSPGAHWLLGLLFVIVGTLIAMAVFNADDWQRLQAWERAVVIGMGGAAVLAGLWVLSAAPLSSLSVDRRHDSIVIVRRGLNGRRESALRVSDVSRVHLAERRDDEGGETFQMQLVLRDGRRVPVSQLWVHGRATVMEATSRLALALGVPVGT